MSDLAAGMEQVLGDGSRVLTQPQMVERLSKDFYWYSPVLKAMLDNKRADVVVQPVNVEEIRAVLQYCHAHEVPVTVRGAGTGNYGQAIPLNGGVVLDLQRMDKIEAIGEDGVAVCEPGVRLGVLETSAREVGWELRCYPSTVAKASLGGFLGGGSGGVGSVKHGGLRDFETVRAIEVVTMESEPRVVKHEGQAVHEILHAWGTNGVITRIWFALAPAVAWSQVVLTFKSFDEAFNFSERIATDATWDKRLITVFEWPLPSYFGPVKQLVREGEASVFFLIADAQMDTLREVADEAGAAVMLAQPYAGLRSQPLLSDYTWNHTTLWAMKADPTYTYLQCGFSPERAREQFALLKSRYGEDFLLHIEWMKNGQGVMIPGAIPVVRFSTEERLNEMIDYCREIGVFVANPHVNHVEGGGRYREDNVQLQAKYKYDAKGLMNPGKMASFARRQALEEQPA
ncbi:FAD-binding protein [Granulicella sp. 5B5]|uniref:FAD-binding oxidoreductase n=1 Tax=Granulicella sp. 5B5 TaxID=1617967 RepID=UPI0015F778B5|nr:FAD-binding oxidoreductase [Granulicella sp. 5B5]QMV19465.1 FAD-binding protein [Granulicella sp. 5B5]